MWFYNKEAEESETLTYLETGAQITRSGKEIWWRGNVLDRPLEQDEMRIAKGDGKRLFRCIVDALLAKDELAGYSAKSH